MLKNSKPGEEENYNSYWKILDNKSINRVLQHLVDSFCSFNSLQKQNPITI